MLRKIGVSAGARMLPTRRAKQSLSLYGRTVSEAWPENQISRKNRDVRGISVLPGIDDA